MKSQSASVPRVSRASWVLWPLRTSALVATLVVATGCTTGMISPKPVTLPATSPAPQPVTLPSTSPAPQPGTLPATSPGQQPTILPVPGPATQPTILPVPGPATQPTILPVPAPTPKPTTLPATSPAQQPAIQPSVQPAARPAAVPSALDNPSRRPCTPEWFSYLEKHYTAVGDAQGHGPDLGSDEWIDAFERRRNLPSTSALPREQRCATLARELDYRY